MGHVETQPASPTGGSIEKWFAVPRILEGETLWRGRKVTGEKRTQSAASYDEVAARPLHAISGGALPFLLREQPVTGLHKRGRHIQRPNPNLHGINRQLRNGNTLRRIAALPYLDFNPVRHNDGCGRLTS
jgi:hypothetical protein